MGKIFKSLPFKLLLGVVVGILLGLVANEAVMNVVVTIKQVLGQIITFCVPLIVIGFIAPSITKLGHNASRMLMVALVLAYCSSVGAALATGASPLVSLLVLSGHLRRPSRGFHLRRERLRPRLLPRIFVSGGGGAPAGR